MKIEQQKRNGEWDAPCGSSSFRLLAGMAAYTGNTVLETEWLDRKGDPVRWRVSFTKGELNRLLELLAKEKAAA